MTTLKMAEMMPRNFEDAVIGQGMQPRPPLDPRPRDAACRMQPS